MRIHDYTRQDIKRLADRMQKRLGRSGVQVDFPAMLEALAAGFETRDWNTLSGMLPDAPAALAVNAATTVGTGIPTEARTWSLEARMALVSEGAPTTPAAAPHQEIVIGHPGTGKSMLTFVDSLKFWLDAEGHGVPARLGMVDFGNSASGLLNLLRDSLPPDRMDEVVVVRIGEGAATVNPFDTPLGARTPGPLQRDLLVNLVCLAAHSAQGHPDLRQMASAAIDEAYADCHERRPDSFHYMPGLDPLVDRALEARNLKPTSWWDCVDGLFEKLDFRDAARAQRQAVPRLGDVANACLTLRMREPFASWRLQDGTSLPDAVARDIISASRTMPAFADRTTLDLDRANVLLVDIGGIKSGERFGPISHLAAQAVVMNAVGVFARDTELGRDPKLGQGYRRHHARDTARIRVVFDEMARCQRVGTPLDQFGLLLRAGRRTGVNIVLSTQVAEDLTGEAVGAATRIRLLGTILPSSESFLHTRLEPSVAVMNLLRRQHGPTRQGTRFLTCVDKEGSLRWHAEEVKLDAKLKWALTTTARDMILREELTAKFGRQEALRKLAAHYPFGTAGGWAKPGEPACRPWQELRATA